MTNLDNEYVERFIKKIITQAGKETLKLFGKTGVKYTKKHIADVVTEADLISNKIITSAIKQKFPSHEIISEETKNNGKITEYTWIIDPLDGTRNFVTKTPLYCILIALTKNNEVVQSAAYLPYFDELYYASKGKGAFLNDKKIHCNNQENFYRSYGTGASTTKKNNFFKALLKSETKTNFWINDFGSLAINALYVADGRRDWFFTTRAGGVWDLAAVYLILKESGCKVTNINGKLWALNYMNMVSANPKMHTKIMNIYKKYQ